MNKTKKFKNSNLIFVVFSFYVLSITIFTVLFTVLLTTKLIEENNKLEEFQNVTGEGVTYLFGNNNYVQNHCKNFLIVLKVNSMNVICKNNVLIIAEKESEAKELMLINSSNYLYVRSEKGITS